MYRNLISAALAIGLLAASTLSAPAQVYGPYNNLPGGSYQQSCSNATMRGSILSASCNAPNGRQIWSQIDVSRCNGAAIANNGGYLTCQGNGYNRNARNGYYRNGPGSGRHHGRDKDERGDNDDDNGNVNNGYYGNNGYNNGYGLPPGSYQQSCTNERISGTTLYASCAAANGGYRNTAIDVRQCQSQGRPIENINGNLAC